MFELNRLNKENIPPNSHQNQRGVLKDKTNKMQNDSFLKRTHSMDIQQKQPSLANPNVMNLEAMENYQGVKYPPPMETEELNELDKFDEANKHNPQMVSLYAKQIFEYLREREVILSPHLGAILAKRRLHGTADRHQREDAGHPH